jgi:hypothetical protein
MQLISLILAPRVATTPRPVELVILQFINVTSDWSVILADLQLYGIALAWTQCTCRALNANSTVAIPYVGSTAFVLQRNARKQDGPELKTRSQRSGGSWVSGAEIFNSCHVTEKRHLHIAGCDVRAARSEVDANISRTSFSRLNNGVVLKCHMLEIFPFGDKNAAPVNCANKPPLAKLARWSIGSFDTHMQLRNRQHPEYEKSPKERVGLRRKGTPKPLFSTVDAR